MKRKEDLAFTINAVVLAIVMTLVTWRYNGLRDASLLAYPCILMMISMVGRLWLLISMLIYMVCSLTLLYTLNVMGIYTTAVNDPSLITVVQIGLILGSSTWIVWVVNKDTRDAYESLNQSHLFALDSKNKIEFMANHDALTQLPTRALARDRFEHMMALCKRYNHKCALVFVDLDNFKSINDSMGHKAGDLYLQHVADVLRESVRETDLVCRQSGDEFLIMIENVYDKDDVVLIMDRVIEGLHAPFTIEGVVLTASCSMGAALYPQDGTGYDEIIKNADTAMYRAKESGRNGYCFYDQSSHSWVKENVHLMSGLRHAITNDELVLHYQPQFCLSSGKLLGAEALVRWNHPTEGLLPPAKFIHLAETSGLINELGQWVLQKACTQNRLWLDQGLEVVMAVNLSPMQFRRKDLDKVVEQTLFATGLPGQYLELELTESLFVEDSTDVLEMLKRINDMGVLLSIDDFGTGYSNLSYLRRMPVHRIKIDQSFVRNMDHHNQSLINVIIQMSEQFNLTSVAEGIEDIETLKKLRLMGCNMGQGYHWDKPLPIADFNNKYIFPDVL